MQYFVYTEAGHNHLNEDVVLVRQHPQDPTMLLCALADGQGGHSGGAAAARIAVEKCLEIAAVTPAEQLTDERSWYPIISEADRAVCDDPESGLTTLIGLCISNGNICGASCGDSAAQLITPKQSVVLTDDQRKNPPVGSCAAYPVAFQAEFPNGSQLLAMSDGVWRSIGHETIARLSALKHGQELIAALHQEQARQNGGLLPDDFSIILVE